MIDSFYLDCNLSKRSETFKNYSTKLQTFEQIIIKFASKLIFTLFRDEKLGLKEPKTSSRCKTVQLFIIYHVSVIKTAKVLVTNYDSSHDFGIKYIFKSADNRFSHLKKKSPPIGATKSCKKLQRSCKFKLSESYFHTHKKAANETLAKSVIKQLSVIIFHRPSTFCCSTFFSIEKIMIVRYGVMAGKQAAGRVKRKQFSPNCVDVPFKELPTESNQQRNIYGLFGEARERKNQIIYVNRRILFS